MIISTRLGQPVPFLIWVAVKGVVASDQIAAHWDDRQVEGVDELVARGILADDDGYVYLTEAGDSFLSEELLASLDEAERADFETFALSFEAIDQEFKDVATRWQGLGGDRADLSAADVVESIEEWITTDERLRDLVAGSSPVVADLLQPSLDGLASALAAFLAGDHSLFTGSDESTYHSVWFVMHETILRGSGQTR